MAVVTGTESRSEVRDVYVPPTETGMAHRSQLSPDRRWVLIASEMNASGWLPCRVVPIEGGSAGRIVGPRHAKCTYAAWSPDGQWMYFSADVGEGFHIWRQRFPDGMPEQITFGATEEEGIAMWPDGRSFASSVGTTISSIWVHDAGRERQITSEGYGQLPSFSADGKKLYYLLRGTGVRQWAAGELWAFDLATGSRRRIFDGYLDGAVPKSQEMAPAWCLYGPIRVRKAYGLPTSTVACATFRSARNPRHRCVLWAGRNGCIAGRGRQAKYLFRVREDGSGRQKVTTEPIIRVMSVSPDRRWAVAWTQGSGDVLSRPTGCLSPRRW